MTDEPAFFELGVEDPARPRVLHRRVRLAMSPARRARASYRPGGIPGGLHPGDKGASPYLFFGVDDMDAALARVHELGGSVEDDARGRAATTASIARYGRFKRCRDDQGSPFGLHQPPAA